MGTWDVGPFDNDTAADWCGTFDDAAPDARRALVRDTLARAADTTDYLDADIGDEAVAAAALVAAQCPGGDPAHPHYGPKQPVPDLTDLGALALRALDRILTEPSELLELWADSDGDPWHTTINGLRTTLTPRPPGEQLHRI
ncbi:protein of unknown function [Streptomyces sp. 3213]|uniref:DUF4259 domain-containing protein n=1 Tax=Streptomyces sp. 3213.3 TaxID=1855348 RepID=UPI0008967C4B|nr:DUF4259 domain-containing protein [Streptomyces sp. 3213.3]SEE47272.1 protein of unknown function [Streptomyces sp. 3213] [Streptomyces sp. 3213.3]